MNGLPESCPRYGRTSGKTQHRMSHPDMYVKSRQDTDDSGRREARSDISLEYGRG